MFLSRSRSLKIKNKLFNKIKHASWTCYNNLASRSGPYWSLNFMDCAMENTPYFPIPRLRCAEVQRPVNITGASGRPVFSAVRSPTALFRGGSI